MQRNMTRPCLFVIIILSLILFLTPVSAQTRVDLDNSFIETWNNGNIALPSPGTVTLPKGSGIMTITTVQEPFYKTVSTAGSNQVIYQNSQNSDDTDELGLYLGETFYQKEAVMGAINQLSDGLPLTRVSRYYSNLHEEKNLNVQIVPAIVNNTDHQLANRVRYSTSWEPLKTGRATDPGCDISGTWKTNWGNITLSDGLCTPEGMEITGSYIKENQGTFQGTLTGPVLTGVWSEPEVKTGEDSGRFTFFFRNDCCAFTGTWGTGESDTNGGEWSGNRY